jgi:hypothetical protein
VASQELSPLTDWALTTARALSLCATSSAIEVRMARGITRTIKPSLHIDG